MTSACGSFLGLGGRTEEAAELAMLAPYCPSERRRGRMTTETRASDASAVSQLGGAGTESQTESSLLNIHEPEAECVVLIRAA